MKESKKQNETTASQAISVEDAMAKLQRELDAAKQAKLARLQSINGRHLPDVTRR